MNIAALGPALVVIVYGLGSPPDAAFEYGEPDTVLTMAAPASVSPGDAPLVQANISPPADQGSRIEAPRECVASAGITEACIYE